MRDAGHGRPVEGQLRAADALRRLGGDEFGVLVRDAAEARPSRSRFPDPLNWYH